MMDRCAKNDRFVTKHCMGFIKICRYEGSMSESVLSNAMARATLGIKHSMKNDEFCI